MTPSERERRIKAAASTLEEALYREMNYGLGAEGASVVAREILDAAHEAVPVVSETVVDEMVWLRREEQRETLERRVERAETELARTKTEAMRVTSGAIPTSWADDIEARERAEAAARDAEASATEAYERGVIDGLYRAGLDEDEVALMLRPRPGEEGTEG